MNTKGILAIVAGILSWWVGFFAIGGAFALLVPGFIEASRIAQSENDWSQFTTPLLLCLVAMYFVINPLAGWVTTLIAKNQKYVWGTIILLTLYAAHSHLYRLWDNLANWYNVAVVVLIPPLAYLGSKLIKTEAAKL